MGKTKILKLTLQSFIAIVIIVLTVIVVKSYGAYCFKKGYAACVTDILEGSKWK